MSDLLVEDIWNNMNVLYRKEEVSKNRVICQTVQSDMGLGGNLQSHSH